MLHSEQQAIAIPPALSHCTWDGIFHPINNLSMSCRSINKRNSVSNMQCGYEYVGDILGYVWNDGEL